MKKNYPYIFLLMILFIFTAIPYADTVKIATYNILNFPEIIGMQKFDDLRIVVDYINPDILVIQEMGSQEGVELFLDSVMNYYDKQFDAVPFNDGPYTDNSIFYRTNKVEFLSALYIPTPHRDIAEYRLRIIESERVFYIFSVHLKSSQGASNEMMRFQEATILRNHLDSLEQGTNFLVMGDFNIYSSDEQAFQKLTGSFTNNNGRLFDPLNAPGEWHENNSFAYTHTQSSRVEQLEDGGAGGGLDDRFDMVLCSQSFLDSVGLYLLSQSYTVCGNDGNHFNAAVNDGFNQSVPENVADALYYASDHLPVFVSIIDLIDEEMPKDFVKIWPNPMKHKTRIQFPWVEDFQKAKIWITNILGQRVYESEIHDPNGFTLRKGRLPVGIYFIHAVIEAEYIEYNYRTKLAVVE